MLLAGPGLLIASGAIHLDLYLTGYRSIPTIGWLFLLQVIAAFGLGLAVLALRSRLAAAAAAGFALATLGGYLLSVWIGLFGFKEVRTTAGITAGVLEIAAFTALAGYALTPPRATPQHGPGRVLARLTARPAGPRNWAPPPPPSSPRCCSPSRPPPPAARARAAAAGCGPPPSAASPC